MENYSLGCNVWHCKNGMCIDECNSTGVYLKDIVKHSKNIIDLIEDGDYLNGYLVRKINGELCNFDLNNMKWIPLKNIDILENLVTHEQFKSIEYKIKERGRKMKVIELLNKMANDEKFRPTVKFLTTTYTYDKRMEDYNNNETSEWGVFSDYTINNILNDEVELIEETKEIEEFTSTVDSYHSKETICQYCNAQTAKINELVRAVNKLNKEREEK